MKKFWLFFFSFIVAIGITLYTKQEKARYTFTDHDQEWKTFIKKPSREVASYKSTEEELMAARITKKKSVGRSPNSVVPNLLYNYRGNRVLFGDRDSEFSNPDHPLPMENVVHPDWQQKLGEDLMRFQSEDTKILVKNEMPIIRVMNGKGRFYEQVIVTYLSRNGDRSSFKALVDSETGVVEETWDRTIHEAYGRRKEGLSLPSGDNNITTR